MEIERDGGSECEREREREREREKDEVAEKKSENQNVNRGSELRHDHPRDSLQAVVKLEVI